MIKTLIVDDEPLAIEILEAYASQIPQLQLVAKCTNALEANRILQLEKIDLMFLDIEMPLLLGTEFLKSLQNPPKVIFTTAYPEFAVQGFELNALDYLLKPISMERFVKSINKLFEKNDFDIRPEIEQNTEYIFVKADKRLIKVNFDEILYIEGLKDYVIIRTDQNKIITLQTMKSLEEKLPATKFIRVHRSFIVNLNKINAIVGNAIEILEKGQNKHIPIGNNYKDEIEKMIEKRKL